MTDAFPAIEEATAADLLQAFDATSPWTLSFPHPLVRAAVYDALGPARRRALHTQAAALLTDEAAVLRHRVAAAAEPDEELAADLTRFADAQARRQDWQSAAAHAVAASRLSPDPGSAQRRVLRAVIWAMLRGDAANAGQYAADAAGYAPSALRDVVLGSLAMAADDPTTAEQLLTAAWRESALPADPEAAGIAALMTAIHWYGRLDAPATVRWCERALAVIPPESSTYPIAQTYLVHGLGYAGQTDEAALAAVAGPGAAGRDGAAVGEPAVRARRPAPGRGRDRCCQKGSGVRGGDGVPARASSTPRPSALPISPGPNGWPAPGTRRCCMPSGRWRSIWSPISGSCSPR